MIAVSTLASWKAHSEEVSGWLEYLQSLGRGPCGEEPAYQPQRASNISEPLGNSILGSQISDNKATGNIWLQLPEKAGLDLPTKRLLNAWPTENARLKMYVILNH